ncbi:hypothetical protein MRB53_041686 [Persea americana]|nr:hypothetical protein MRB53_041686 [Persea americana]
MSGQALLNGLEKINWRSGCSKHFNMAPFFLSGRRNPFLKDRKSHPIQHPAEQPKEAFFDDAITKFLTLCSDKSMASIIPSGAIHFSHAIAVRLQQQSKYRKGFASYVRCKMAIFIIHTESIATRRSFWHAAWSFCVGNCKKLYLQRDRSAHSAHRTQYCLWLVCVLTESIRCELTSRAGSIMLVLPTQQIDLVRKIIALFEMPEGLQTEQTKANPVAFNFAVSAGDVLTTIDSLFHRDQLPQSFRIPTRLDQVSVPPHRRYPASPCSRIMRRVTRIWHLLVLRLHQSWTPNLTETSIFTDARDDLADLAQATESRSWSVVHVDDATEEIIIPRDALANNLAQLDLNDQSPSWWRDSLCLAREDRLTSRKGDLEAAQDCDDIRIAYAEYIEHSGSKALSEVYQATKSNAITGKTAAARHNIQLESSISLESETGKDSEQFPACKSGRSTKSSRQDVIECYKTSKWLKKRQQLHASYKCSIVEILSVNSAYGGPNKLTNDQSRIVSTWLAQYNVDVICTSEERIHKLCMEIRKCADQSTNASKADNPMLWSDILFANEQTNTVHDARPRQRLTTETPRNLMTSIHPATWSAAHDLKSPASQTLSHASSSEFHDFRSPTLTSRSSYIWSPAMTETRSNSSATSIGSYPADSRIVQGESKTAKWSAQLEKQLAHRITGLIVSDLTTQLFRHGSETDLALFSGLGSGLSSQLQRNSQHQRLPHTHQHTAGLDVNKAVARTIERFALTSNPCHKLKLLSTLQRLLPEFMVLQYGHIAKRWSATTNFHVLFSDDQLRPKAIFRELQFMAAFLPASHLQKDMFGGAFVHAAGAANILKSQMISTMIETADGIIAFHTSNRGHSRTSASTAQHQRDSAAFSLPKHTDPSVDFSAYSMADAGELLQITAKEGNPAAQRELATLYLTHPELMDNVIAPFALPRDVFREELESKWRNQDKSRCDPLTMCVAHHWMLLSSRGGDALAKEYLRQREEMERLP